jgi:hypothetical protein
MLKTVQDNLANLLAGNQTPDDFVSALDKDYQSYLATLK